MNHRNIALVASLLVGLPFSVAATAGIEDQARRPLSLSDVDLSSPPGLKDLQRRIEQAANAVCLDATGPAPTGRVDPTCKREAMNDARRQLAQALPERLPETADVPPASSPNGF